MAPRKLAAGNWKMNGTPAALAEIDALLADTAAHGVDLLICPPATLIQALAARAEERGRCGAARGAETRGAVVRAAGVARAPQLPLRVAAPSSPTVGSAAATQSLFNSQRICSGDFSAGSDCAIAVAGTCEKGSLAREQLAAREGLAVRAVAVSHSSPRSVVRTTGYRCPRTHRG